MVQARVTVDRDFTLGPVPRRLFGSFVEHMGRCVYTGVVEPGHPEADAAGLRRDVLELTRELGVSVVRYPGGNFVSGYDWEDGVGPVEERPRRLDGAWHTVEPNTFGLHEFVDWARLAGVEVMEAVNLGTRGVSEARALLEYANHPGGTELSDRRRRNGAEEPFGIKLWCLGNEMDGPWQIGFKTADEYGRLAAEAARAMRMVDDDLELVACGSSNLSMPTFGAWEETVLTHTYDLVDYISLHVYYSDRDGDAESFLASAVDMDRFIEAVVATADFVRARDRHTKTMYLSFDEWNVTYRHDPARPAVPEAEITRGWDEHPPIGEGDFDVTEGVVVGTLLSSLLRHGDRVKIANQAQLVNLLGMIRTQEGGPAWRQTVFFPFAAMAAAAAGEILRLAVTSDRATTARYGEADLVDVSGTWDAGSGRLALFLANRSLAEDAEVDVALRGLVPGEVLSARVLAAPEGGDRFSVNSAEAQPVGLVDWDGASVVDGGLAVRLPALSWAVVEIAVTAA
ncbi:alpha-N-arabinofuranosidase [Microlunatus capsulatus]|uniref:non-reducing end alpha-L-arabinofuranosidase n=1 Tax=Microlunatus capsulatus TaxID=99117 RepID=A0ABS4Z2C0_9ACTN|nr:alpha-L-arabinofuranosidase C-terminal domain-containing protein [Microlunatus capsulatus]MBP2415196.1 alpha-N-arabinofuranosidase [Microlunatus capsulatus]